MLLIAGSNGYVGKFLVSLLNSKQIDFATIQLSGVEPISNRSIFLLKDQKKTILAEGEASEIVRTLSELGLKSTINLAADTNKNSDPINRLKLIQSNFEYNKDLIELSISAGIDNFHFITTYSSSIDGVTFSPQTFYAGTKYISEKLLETYAICNLINCSIIEIFDIYGPFQPHKRLVNYCFESLINGNPIHISKGEQEINLVHVEDVVHGLYEIVHSQLEKPKPIDHHSLYGYESYKVKEIPIKIANYLAIPNPEEEVSFTYAAREREIMFVKPRFKRPKNWQEAYTLESGVKHMFKLNSNRMISERETEQ
jgi:nucleoside-diphosphate-sugar epimerase